MAKTFYPERYTEPVDVSSRWQECASNSFNNYLINMELSLSGSVSLSESKLTENIQMILHNKYMGLKAFLWVPPPALQPVKAEALFRGDQRGCWFAF
ncbi:MAG: hypothetical protein JW915_13150 [Chitinispirillaceae bacterium]|nr:hypothetical protein [Chitinispirillaceae bacterium]